MSNLDRVMANIGGKFEAAMWRAEKQSRLAKKIDDEYTFLFNLVDQNDAVQIRRKTLISRMRKVMPDHPIAMRG